MLLRRASIHPHPFSSTVPELIVVSRSESFGSVWPQLAAEAGLDLRAVADPGAAEALASAVACVIAVGGVEDEAGELLRTIQAAGVAHALVVGAREDHRLAIALVRAGAADYFALPADLEPLRGELLERARRREARVAGDRLAAAERQAYDFGRIIGSSPALRVALDHAARIIPRDRVTVLLTGETGTGKELLARALHYNGPRAAEPFVEINCTAIPANLLEAELFGHEKGAFTDAHVAKPGLFEIAAGGTLFLDEIGDLPLELQGKLLKVLEEKQIRRIGAVRTRHVDVRIIAATNVDLAEAVRRGGFREDLYYRLSVIPIHLPPLRDRGDDVLLLADHFLASLAEQYDLPRAHVTPELRRALLSHHWPGNVRELRNALERSALLGGGSADPAHLFLHQPLRIPASDGAIPFPAPLADIERAAARAMLDRTAGNKAAAAQALGISRSRLYRLMAADAVSK